MRTQTCNKCNETKPVDDFYLLTGSQSQRYKMCKVCKNDNAKSQYHQKKLEDPNHSKRRWIQSAYHLSWEAYEELVAAGCSLCGRKDSKSWEVDHEHRCCPGRKTCGKCIRGLLCHDCNQMLGRAKDSVVLLHRAIEYLTKWDEVYGPAISSTESVSSR